MTHPFLQKQLRFFLTAPAPCPYLPGREERKVFTHLQGPDSEALNDVLTQAGFRRSQTIAYRPACEGCDACQSARIRVTDFVPSASMRRTLARNRDLVAEPVAAVTTREHYALLQRYLDSRHKDGGMADMSFFDTVAMIEETSVNTHMVEYRLPGENNTPGQLLAVALVDGLSDGLSLVYSFFDTDAAHKRRSLGSYIILQHIEAARTRHLPYVYLGYWVPGSDKMAYKARFKPLEILQKHADWRDLTEADENQPPPPIPKR